MRYQANTCKRKRTELDTTYSHEVIEGIDGNERTKTQKKHNLEAMLFYNLVKSVY